MKAFAQVDQSKHSTETRVGKTKALDFVGIRQHGARAREAGLGVT